jgi:esterase/lipase
VHKKISTLSLIIAFAFTLNGCVSMSAQERRERAYRHYVQKQMKHRQREIARAQKAANREMKRKMKNIQPSEPQLTTSLEPLSESRPEPMTDMTVAPISVSASAPIPTDTTIEPSQP